MLWYFMLVPFFSSQVIAHSWMSCPRSFSQFRGRGGTQTAPCENWYQGATNVVDAGDRLKVGWTSNNHGGGYVRISLIKATPGGSESNYFGATEAAFKQNVIKFGCFGHDTRDEETKFGDCFHPCNARRGCEFQSELDDVERYDTTITVPTNLDDGLYILQTAMLVGNSIGPYYSCAKLEITGGNPSLSCQSPDPPPKYVCHQAGGPNITALSDGTTRGEFCFHSDRRGEVDDRILEKPRNVECDPRIYCGLSTNQLVCYQEDGMEYLDDTSGDPKQDCGNNLKTETCKDGIKNQGEEGVDCGGPCTKKCATCSDGIKNQDEEDIDCGGSCTASCTTCFDNVKNYKELGVDCGGPCKKCAQCTDGIKNHDETGIDCGGEMCAACATCTDGIQNQGENGVDCGGPCCNTCVATCSDNIHNQGEEGVDCGGPCKACVKVESVDYLNVKHLETDWGSGPVKITIEMTFLKDVPSNWKLRIEYNQKINIDSYWGAASVVDENEFGTIFTFQQNSWVKLPKEGETQKIEMMVTKYGDETLLPTGEFFEVGGINELGKRSMYDDELDELSSMYDDELGKRSMYDDKGTKKGLPKKGKSKKGGARCGKTICPLGEYCHITDLKPCRKPPCKPTEECKATIVT